MKFQQHNIGKMTLDITFDSKQEADQLQHLFPGTIEKKLKQSIEETFDQALPDNEVVVIEKIELDLGTVNQEEWLSGLHNRIKDELTKILYTKMNSANTSDISELPQQSVWSEILILYLKTGSFPWWVGQITLKQLEKEVLKETVSGNETLPERYTEVFGNKLMVSRLSAQFSAGFKKQLFFNLFPAYALFIKETVQNFDAFFRRKIHAYKIRQASWTDWIWPLSRLANQRDVFKQQFTTRFFLQVCKKYHLKPKTTVRELPESLRVFLTKDLKADLTETTKDDEISDRKNKSETKELIVSNAGLVVVWPFLPQLFSNLKLTDASVFLSESHRERAICHIQYLVYGTTHAEEHQVLLNKMLAGWPIEKPLANKISLRKKEKEILDDFLQEIIAQWKALKKTSVSDLRQTFLQRNGIVRTIKNRHHLKVERKGVDILRDNLPWGINIIKLPWMDKILYVEW